MKVKVNLREALTSAWSDTPTIPATIDLDEVFEFLDTGDEHEVEVEIDELLQQNRTIGHLWTVEDVQSIRDDLDPDQAWTVLQGVEHDLDSTRGVTWDVIEQKAYDLFGSSYRHRAQRCANALVPYDGELVDLLADALHWSRANGYDFEATLAMAREHFDAETPNE